MTAYFQLVELRGQVFYGYYFWCLGATVAISKDGNRIFFSFGGQGHMRSDGTEDVQDDANHVGYELNWSSETNDEYKPGSPIYPDERWNRVLGYEWDSTINKYKRFYTIIASTETQKGVDSGLECNGDGTRIIIGQNNHLSGRKGKISVFNQDTSDGTSWSIIGTFTHYDGITRNYLSGSANNAKLGYDVGIARDNDDIICFTLANSNHNSLDINSDTVNRTDPYGKSLQDHTSGSVTHKIYKLTNGVWEQMSFGEFYSPKFDRRFIPGRLDTNGELGVTPISSELSDDGLTFLYCFLGGFAWSKYENNRWSDPYYYFFPVSNPPALRDTPNWNPLNYDYTNMDPSDADYLILPESYRSVVNNIDEYYYPDKYQAPHYTSSLTLSGNGNYVIVKNTQTSKPYSEDTSSTGADQYHPGPWISFYKLASDTNKAEWLQGFENLGNNSFISTYTGLSADDAPVISDDGSVINITRTGVLGNYAMVEGQGTWRYGVLLSFKNNNL